MRKINKTSLAGRTATILRGNEGTSIVLVTIIAILVITAVVILRMVTSSLLASSDKQYNQDQAYMLATSMGTTIDDLIQEKVIVLTNYTDSNGTVILNNNPSKLPNANVTVTVIPSGLTGYIVNVEAKVGQATYLYSAFYSRAGNSNNYTRQIL